MTGYVPRPQLPAIPQCIRIGILILSISSIVVATGCRHLSLFQSDTPQIPAKSQSVIVELQTEGPDAYWELRGLLNQEGYEWTSTNRDLLTIKTDYRSIGDEIAVRIFGQVNHRSNNTQVRLLAHWTPQSNPRFHRQAAWNDEAGSRAAFKELLRIARKLPQAEIRFE